MRKLINKIRQFFGLKPQRYYGHIISLGYNCEVSFQFFKKYHFTESSLFAWCACPNINTMINSINNLDKVGAGEFKPVKPMWQCQNTMISFHGKGSSRLWNDNPTQEFFDNDLKELKSRLAHLRQKFITVGQDGKKNLYIYKCSHNEETLPQETLVPLLYSLYETIGHKCSNPFDLLIVLEKDTLPDIEQKIQNEHIFIRRVKFFTHPAHVTSKPYDKRGWGKVFSEFKPDFKLPKRKHYKFEQG